MEALKKVWVYIITAFLILLALFGMERSRRKEAEADLSLAESDKKDAVLEERQNNVKAEIEEQIKNTEAEKGRKLTTGEMEDFLKKL